MYIRICARKSVKKKAPSVKQNNVGAHCWGYCSKFSPRHFHEDPWGRLSSQSAPWRVAYLPNLRLETPWSHFSSQCAPRRRLWIAYLLLRWALRLVYCLPDRPPWGWIFILIGPQRPPGSRVSTQSAVWRRSSRLSIQSSA